VIYYVILDKLFHNFAGNPNSNLNPNPALTLTLTQNAILTSKNYWNVPQHSGSSKPDANSTIMLPRVAANVCSWILVTAKNYIGKARQGKDV